MTPKKSWTPPGKEVPWYFTYQPILHIFILNCFTRRDAVGDVQVNKFCWQFYCCSKSVYHLQQNNQRLLQP